MSSMIQPHIRVDTQYVPPAELALPALAVQITRLVDTYMLWVGTTEVEPEEAQNAPLQGCLSKDWACAMPARDDSGTPAAATSLYRSSDSDTALSMAQRLGVANITTLPLMGHSLSHSGAARRFKKQIFLSIDMPPSLGSLGQEGRLLLAIERTLVDILRSDEKGTAVGGA